ncbi:MAG TPA: hypothetical protein DEA22_01830 [Blastocatellia bacterium]|nr:hypothetical protein [Blastocatellia bacterium]
MRTKCAFSTEYLQSPFALTTSESYDFSSGIWRGQPLSAANLLPKEFASAPFFCRIGGNKC